jgi:hypothetical protein
MSWRFGKRSEASGQGSAKRRASRGNKRISLICRAKQGGSKGDGPLGRRTKSEKGRHRAKRGLEGGRRSGFPLQKVAAGKFAGLRAHTPSLFENNVEGGSFIGL